MYTLHNIRGTKIDKQNIQIHNPIALSVPMLVLVRCICIEDIHETTSKRTKSKNCLLLLSLSRFSFIANVKSLCLVDKKKKVDTLFNFCDVPGFSVLFQRNRYLLSYLVFLISFVEFLFHTNFRLFSPTVFPFQSPPSILCLNFCNFIHSLIIIYWTLEIVCQARRRTRG